MKKEGLFTSKNVAVIALLVALVAIFQFIGGYLRVGAVNFTIVLIPIVIGSIILGKAVGAILGFLFGVIVLIQGVTGLDPFTYFLFSQNPFMTIAICLVKGTVAGFLSGLTFELLSKKNEYVATVVSAIVAPVVNTGLFIIGSLIIKNVITAYMQSVNLGVDVFYFLIIMCAGVNFLIEVCLNAICAPSLYKLTKTLKRR